MTWRNLLRSLKDPTIVIAILVMLTSELQAQTNALLDWLGADVANRLVQGGALLAAVLRILQQRAVQLPAPDDEYRKHQGDDDIQ